MTDDNDEPVERMDVRPSVVPTPAADEADERIVTPSDVASLEARTVTCDDQLAVARAELTRLRDERDHYRRAYDSLVDDIRRAGESEGDIEGGAFRRLACQHVEAQLRDLGVAVVQLWRSPISIDGRRFNVTLSLRGGLGDINGESLFDVIRSDRGESSWPR